MKLKWLFSILVLALGLGTSVVATEEDDAGSPLGLPGYTNFGLGYSRGRSFVGPSVEVESVTRRDPIGVAYEISDLENGKITFIDFDLLCWSDSTGNVTYERHGSDQMDPPFGRVWFPGTATDYCHLRVWGHHSLPGYLNIQLYARYE